jgi:deoxyribodipyrimidine photo-lyase
MIPKENTSSTGGESLLQVVWLKRDIRIYDHAPIVEATRTGPTLIIYILEPSIWQAKDMSKRHLAFVVESLRSLEHDVRKRGGFILYAVSEMEPVLESIFQQYGPFRLLAHEEYGTPWTFERDKKVHRWMRLRGLSFVEYQHFGVTRRLRSRQQFNHLWRRYIEADVLQPPERFVMGDKIPTRLCTSMQSFANLDMNGDWVDANLGQKGGEREAHRQLKKFLSGTYADYLKSISSPFLAEKNCSRLSPYLAWGNISLRYVVQQSESVLDNGVERWAQKSMLAYLSRCHWHCHFIQRIEDQPDIAIRTLNPAFDKVRVDWNEEWFQKWASGTTGVPLIDAGMRALHQTGWVNFRMRAILVSFVCNTLLLDWRKPAEHLARLFIDYEPGIHYSQVQMQAGVTGFNTIRIYNPYKQAEDHDPDERFIRKYIPEWDGPSTYIQPIIDVEQANRVARDILWGIKKNSETRTISKKLLARHGSRKKASVVQMEFELDGIKGLPLEQSLQYNKDS